MLKIIHFLKDITPPIIWKYLSYLRLRYKKYHGQWEMDKKIEQYLNFDNGYYVELGALDGIGLSNTLYFELNRKWHGVLIEPAPNNYLKCLSNRSTKNSIFCNACTSFEYQDTFVDMIYAHYMSSATKLETDILDPVAHAHSGASFLANSEEKVFRFGAVAASLNSLLIKAKSPTLIDFLSLDVEGAELEVLKGIDHAVYKFKLMCIESRDEKRLTSYLVPKGYELVEKISPHDYLYILKDYNINMLI
jgi:FkbM family methyltransferase